MGADRKGPLAAFVVVAIIAAILLVTSVRSQAAAGWLRNALPSPPKVVSAVDGGFDQIAEQGADLVHRSAALVPPTRPAVSPPTVPEREREREQWHSPSPRVLQPARHHPGTRSPHEGSADQGEDGPDPESGSPATRHDHGRHLGWTHAHGHRHGHGPLHAHHG